MKPHVSVITLGVHDVNRSKQFYAKGLGWPILQEQGPWVCFALGDGSSGFGLLPREALAKDAGVAAESHGFPSFTLTYNVRSEQRVAALLEEAKRAGGAIVKPAEAQPWGGVSGTFTDPDGFLWKVASGGAHTPFAAE
jgi:predicted enzyme related to lactoylglutathione lyase